jgi:hypothetical protein
MAATAPQYAFGSGVLYGRRTSGVLPATPVRFGALQEVSVDIAFTTKQLFGQYQFPLAVGRGTAKVSGKAKFAQLNAQAFNDLFFNQSSIAAGEVVTITAESDVIGASVANQVTVVQSAGYLQDLGVLNATTQQVLQRVTGTPSGTGNYSCNESNGSYAFNSTMNGSTVLISYNYTDAGNGQNIVIANQLLGSSPQFLVVLTETFQALKLTLQLNACMSSKLTFASKLEDFWMQDFDFEAFVDGSNNLGKLSLDAL